MGRNDRGFLCLLLLAGWVLRFAVAVLSPNVQWPDETFQVLEPAHHLVFGYGVVSWEWPEGLRSLTPPGLIAAILLPARLLGWGPEIYLRVIDGVLAAFSLSVAWVAFRSGRGGLAGLVTAAPAVLWCEMVLFAPHALFDVLAADVLVPGLYLAGREGRAARIAAGIMLAFAVCLRPALGPPLLAGLLMILPRSAAAWLPLVAGGVLGTAVYGLGDVAEGSFPLSSTIRQLLFNLHPENNAKYGIGPWNTFVSLEIVHWGSALPFLAGLIVAGARRNAAWIVVALGIFVEYSLIPHKEYRFIYPAIACLMIPMGAGLQRLVEMGKSLGLESALRLSRITIMVFALCSFALCSLIAARLPGMSDEWRRGAAGIAVFETLGADPAVCGVALLPEVPLSYMGGYASLHRPVPVFDVVRAPEKLAASVSDILSDRERSDLPPGFSLAGCWNDLYFGWETAPDRICRYHRPGVCRPPDPAGPQPFSIRW